MQHCTSPPLRRAPLGCVAGHALMGVHCQGRARWWCRAPAPSRSRSSPAVGRRGADRWPCARERDGAAAVWLVGVQPGGCQGCGCSAGRGRGAGARRCSQVPGRCRGRWRLGALVNRDRGGVAPEYRAAVLWGCRGRRRLRASSRGCSQVPGRCRARRRLRAKQYCGVQQRRTGETRWRHAAACRHVLYRLMYTLLS